MLLPRHPVWYDHSNNTSRGVQIMKLLNIQFPPAACHFRPPTSQYSPQDPVLKYRQVCVLPLIWQNKIHTHRELHTKVEFLTYNCNLFALKHGMDTKDCELNGNCVRRMIHFTHTISFCICTKIRVLRTGCWGEYLDQREMKWQEVGENCTMRSFITCTLLQV
jgi:hypothetical protein